MWNADFFNVLPLELLSKPQPSWKATAIAKHPMKTTAWTWRTCKLEKVMLYLMSVEVIHGCPYLKISVACAPLLWRCGSQPSLAWPAGTWKQMRWPFRSSWKRWRSIFQVSRFRFFRYNWGGCSSLTGGHFCCDFLAQRIMYSLSSPSHGFWVSPFLIPRHTKSLGRFEAHSTVVSRPEKHCFRGDAPNVMGSAGGDWCRLSGAVKVGHAF